MNAVREFCMTVAAAAVLSLGRPAVADVPPDEAPFAQTTESPSLSGTVWEGVDWLQQVQAVYRFEKDGVLICSCKLATDRNGKWKQVGDKVTFETFLGCHKGEAVVRGDQFVGDSWSAAGVHWPTVLHPSKSP